MNVFIAHCLSFSPFPFPLLPLLSSFLLTFFDGTKWPYRHRYTDNNLCNCSLAMVSWIEKNRPQNKLHNFSKKHCECPFDRSVIGALFSICYAKKKHLFWIRISMRLWMKTVWIQIRLNGLSIANLFLCVHFHWKLWTNISTRVNILVQCKCKNVHS